MWESYLSGGDMSIGLYNVEMLVVLSGVLSIGELYVYDDGILLIS